jgi:tetratricopeptide (TPR) repeat protein
MTAPIDADKLYAQVWQLRREGQLPEALAITTDALAAARQGGNAKSLARVLCVMGQIERDRGREEDAAACYLEAANIYRGLGEQEGLAYAVRHACDILRELGRLAEAEPLGAEGLAAYRALNAPPLDLANMLRVCALLKEDLGDAAEAKRLWAEAGALYQTARVDAGVEEAKRRGDALN